MDDVLRVSVKVGGRRSKNSSKNKVDAKMSNRENVR